MTASEKNREFEFIEGLTAELSAKELIFPTSLNATMKIRKALSNPDISNDAVARIISAEPVLSAQVLRLSNSIIYNRTNKRISELRVATMALGFAAVRNVAISVGMKQLTEHKSTGQSSQRMEGLWTRSLRVAAMSYVVAKNLTRLSPDKALLAGLLHDVGKFYILNRARHYQDLFVSEKALWDLVDQWHGSIGAAILENWDISDDIRSAVMDCRSPDIPLAPKHTLTDVVATADFLDAHFVAKSIDVVNWKVIPPALQNLQLDQEKVEALMSETKGELGLILQAIA
ncbi:HDOD domain-containing protein [Undibacterium sp. TJN25]|uniref:HDOD domain-containing protein n=1 Tax=Undibacterium sp. TJN25 TaxID=3413056 RepID=UPI003BF370D0